MNNNFMKERPVFPLLMSMALPMILSMMVNSLYNIVDSFFVAKINENAMTALSLVYPVQNFITSVSVGFGVGINALIALNLGKGDKSQADRVCTQGLVLSLLHGMLMQYFCLRFLPDFLRLFHADILTMELSLRYSAIALSFSTILSVQVALEKIFQSIGRMKVSMISMLLGCISNILLDPILIFGFGIVPAMGIEGAALATGIGQTLSLLCYLFFYFKTPMAVYFRRTALRPSFAMLRRLYSIGIPATLNMALPSLLISALNVILAIYSPVYILVLGIYYKLQSFLYLTSSGMVQGMRPLIGFNYGAGEYKRVRQLFRYVLLLCLSLMLFGTLLCWMIPESLMAMFTCSPETIEAGKTALHRISLGFIVSAVSVTTCGALEGLGKGLPSLIISLLRYTVLIIPAAFILSRIYGAVGVWLAFPLAEGLTAIAAFLIYRRESGVQ